MATSGASRPALVGTRRNGSLIVCHPAFRVPLLRLAAEVKQLRRRDPEGWARAPRAKLLKRILDVILTEVPANPASAEYEQGKTLGADARGWRRVKFLGRFRLFFRFDTAARIIVYAWVNDENTLRKRGSATDPYAVFRRMLVGGDPPHGWDALLERCRTEASPELGETLGGLETVPDVARVGPAGKGRGTR